MKPVNEQTAPRRLVIATGNAGKVRDFQTVFQAHACPMEVLSMRAFGGMPEVDETETSFAGNAGLKARAARNALPNPSEVWVVADDSGLSVDVLEGAPGVHSARFAGLAATDEDNRQKLVESLKDVPAEKRSAHFTCHLCLISPSGEQFDFVGICEGRIAFEAAGSQGFGYDPLFIASGENRTWGEMEDGHKNHDSHRARATQQLLQWFETNTA